MTQFITMRTQSAQLPPAAPLEGATIYQDGQPWQIVRADRDRQGWTTCTLAQPGQPPARAVALPTQWATSPTRENTRVTTSGNTYSFKAPIL